MCSKFEEMDYNLSIKSYEVLVDLIKHHHDRLLDYNKTFFTCNSILLGACALIFRNTEQENPSIFLVPVCILGFIISLIWIFNSKRINIDSDLRYFQLREIEKYLKMKNPIFTQGNIFFYKGKLHSDILDDNIKLVWYARLKIKKTNVIISMMFMFIYILILLVALEIFPSALLVGVSTP